MIRKILTFIAALPWVYDQIQELTGARVVSKRLSLQAQAFDSATILDLGGGTGIYRNAWPSKYTYICLEIDKNKVDRFHKKYPDCGVILADATAIPLNDESVDIISCIAVSHHLTDISLAKLVNESARVLKQNGILVFIDAIWVPDRWLSKLMWKYDQGSYPRIRGKINISVSQRFEISQSEQYTALHKYILLRGVKKSSDSKC